MRLDSFTRTVTNSGVVATETLWVAQSEDFPLAEQGSTPQEASQQLRESLAKYLTRKD